jgi:purine-binding chemotaxis protein CheW
VVNLRGRVIPVVDLRCRFGMPVEPDTERTCVVVTQIHGEHGPLSMGVLVEDVAEVVDIPLEQIEDLPDFGPGIRTEFLTGIGRLDERVVMLLDIDAVLSVDDTRTVEGLASDGEKQGVER